MERTVDYLIHHHIIAAEERDLYLFGLRQLWRFAGNLLTALAIGLCMGMIWQSILFSLAYIPLRQYAGGYHARNAKVCYILSTVLILLVLLLIKCLSFRWITVVVLLLLADFIIWLKAPVESENRTLTDGETFVFRKRTRIILAVLNALVLTAYAGTAEQISACILMAIVAAAFMVAVGIIKKRFMDYRGS